MNYILDKAIADYKAIRTVEDLQANELSLQDFAVLYEVLQAIQKDGKAETICFFAAKWCARKEFHIDNTNGRYIIYC